MAAKKISSEEETYSDQSILIFYNNFEGIEQAVLPFMATYMAADPSSAEALQAAFLAADETLVPYITGGTSLGNTTSDLRTCMST